LFYAAQKGNLNEVRTAVDAGAPMEWASPHSRSAEALKRSDDYGGQRAVHIASWKGHKDVVAFLGSRGADVNAGDDNQYTPLHLASYMGHASVCTTLLALGANPTTKDNDGDTALDDARRQNKTECVAMLEAAEAEAVALLRQAEEAAWKACGGPEALAAVAAAVEAGDREKAAAAQKVLEEVASAAGIAVSASFLYLHAACVFFLSRSPLLF
jgi:hypothetical protein